MPSRLTPGFALVVLLFLCTLLEPLSAFTRPSILSCGSSPRHCFVDSRVRMGSAASSSGMQTLPSNVVKYSQVPKQGVFTADKIPKGLLKSHTTKAGTWGMIRVTQGQLEYQIHNEVEGTESGGTPLKIVLEGPDGRGIVEPTVKHQVKPLTDDVQFVVEFHRVPGTGVVDEPREGLA
ncbi:predicted protein [Phaeodactylum tricornutum CCAP 1055/1]|uniref:TehB/YeaR-like domain-containing protein n=1 Tax=Phaeodactylum tricornutum (strain CCAP 1055/1) TaxID=556484 RepID=B7G0W5_PHATC|nr:predicted protein [Phaeodactylum tricornutum CCAP 1055/1]EEC47589.1 predicted protein [Phaeodactylum tricornutum CCAP 1055/1]|eukprot:XP_002180937.1 predicted protein [Phaeodactylum tricornutum CCAP 1055/1]